MQDVIDTSAPNVMNLFDNTDFIFNCPYGFSERFAGGQDSRYYPGSMHLMES